MTIGLLHSVHPSNRVSLPQTASFSYLHSLGRNNAGLEMLYDIHLRLLPKKKKKKKKPETSLRGKTVKVLKSTCFAVISWHTSMTQRGHRNGGMWLQGHRWYLSNRSEYKCNMIGF